MSISPPCPILKAFLEKSTATSVLFWPYFVVWRNVTAFSDSRKILLSLKTLQTTHGIGICKNEPGFFSQSWLKLMTSKELIFVSKGIAWRPSFPLFQRLLLNLSVGSWCLTCSFYRFFFFNGFLGHLGGSVGWASNSWFQPSPTLGSMPSMEPTWDSLSLPLPLPHLHYVSLKPKNKIK